MRTIELIKTRVSTDSHPAVQVIGASLLIALSAQISIAVPFSPVPITGQTFALLLLAALLGPLRAAAAAALYLLEGAAGLPVFAGFSGGIHHLFSATGGYLLAFVPAAWTMGRLSNIKVSNSFLRYSLTALISTVIIFSGGLLWLSRFIDSGLLAAGFYPFIPGALIKIGLGALLFSGLKKLK